MKSSPVLDKKFVAIKSCMKSLHHSSSDIKGTSRKEISVRFSYTLVIRISRPPKEHELEVL